MHKLTLRNISKYYIEKKDNTAIAALYQVNLDIHTQKTSAIIGPSGCGKTTLLKVIAGLLENDEGEILKDDVPIHEKSSIQKIMSYVSQEAKLYPHMTVFDNIAFPLKIEKVPVEEIKTRVFELANLMDIDFLLTRKPRQLSGGQKQKVALARALIKLPKILLLDEPFSNLDKNNKEILKSLIKSLKQKLSLTIVMVTHQMEDTVGLADDIIYMDNGEILSIERSITHDS